MLNQRTLGQVIHAGGVGLHTGDKVTMTLRPAAPDTGVVFRRVDMEPPREIRAAPHFVSDTRLSSTLEHDGVRVATIEHLMSALAGLGVDNVYVDLNASEVPILDGSAGPFVYLLQTAGIVEQAVPKKFIRIKSVIEAHEGDKWVRFAPYEGFRVEFSIDFDHPVIEHTGKSVVIDFAQHSYIREISRARTFGFMHEVESLRAMGLARGGSLDNAVVLDEYRILNSNGLRYEDEFVKHKVLDAIGDLYILGHPLIGAFSAHKSGHALNNKLLRTLLADTGAWEYTTFEHAEEIPGYARFPSQAAA